jgi:hypothetical protein
MTVYLGNAGNVELIRDSGDTITGTIRAVDVNTTRGTFSFDFSFGAFVTGDFVDFSSASTLSFVSGWAYPKGNWFVNVDQIGGLRLYNT